MGTNKKSVEDKGVVTPLSCHFQLYDWVTLPSRHSLAKVSVSEKLRYFWKKGVGGGNCGKFNVPVGDQIHQ